MKTYRNTRNVLGYPIELTCSSLDEGILVVITGGSRTHVGAVSLCEYGQGEMRTFTILRKNHRDDVISKKVAEMLADELKETVTVCCGIHYDYVTPENIREIVKAADDLASELIATVQNNLNSV